MRILMPVDGSACSGAAVDFVASRAKLLSMDTEVELVNIQLPIPPRAARALGKEMVTAHYYQEANQILSKAKTQLSNAGAIAHSYYLVGSTKEELSDVVRMDPADFVVMGSHGKTGLSHLVFGSIAEYLAASSAKPLLIVRVEKVPKDDSLKVAIALDGSEYGVAAANFLVNHFALLGEQPSITLIHVAPELTKLTIPGWLEREVATGLLPEQVAAMHAAAFESVFRPVREVMKQVGVTISEVGLVGNDAGVELANYAEINQLDVLALGSLGFGANRFAPMGSVAHRVASRVKTALLLVREV